jgi:hypothetical protein
MIYELWDGDSRNLVDAYESEEEALADVRTLVELNGLDYAKLLALLVQDEDEELRMIAQGFDLARRANIPVPAPLLAS